ncbi:Cys-tRNA(Pro) deacylase [soil metagenome]
MPTPAIRLLEEAGVTFELHHYTVSQAVGDGYGEAVAAALDVDPERVFKTLVAVADDSLVLAVVPVTSRLSTKALARAAGAKRTAMADPSEAERVTGYVVGGVSPVGSRTRLPLYLDSSGKAFETIFVSAGKRGLQVELDPDDLLAVASGRSDTLT